MLVHNFLSQLPLQDLARGALGQLIQDNEIFGHLKRGEVLLQKRSHFRRV